MSESLGKGQPGGFGIPPPQNSQVKIIDSAPLCMCVCMCVCVCVCVCTFSCVRHFASLYNSWLLQRGDQLCTSCGRSRGHNLRNLSHHLNTKTNRELGSSGLLSHCKVSEARTALRGSSQLWFSLYQIPG